HLPPEWTPILTFLSFASLLTIGQAIQFKRTIKTRPIDDKYYGKSFQPLSWRFVVSLACAILTVPLMFEAGVPIVAAILDAVFDLGDSFGIFVIVFPLSIDCYYFAICKI